VFLLFPEFVNPPFAHLAHDFGAGVAEYVGYFLAVHFFFVGQDEDAPVGFSDGVYFFPKQLI
jgi:hypothetical protein